MRRRPGRGGTAFDCFEPPLFTTRATSETIHQRRRKYKTSKRLSMGASPIVLVLTTAPDDERAETWARTLVEERLAACVNVLGPMVSFYRWKDALERDAERQLVIKTTRGRVPALRRRLKQLHSYDLPEFVVLNADEASDEYLAWVRQQATITRA